MNWIDGQKEVTAFKRSIVIDSFVKWSYSFELNVETLFLAVYLFDSYLTRHRLTIRKLYVFYVTCVFLASKYEERKVRSLDEFINRVSHHISKQRVFEQEDRILRNLNYNLNYICPHDFLKRASHLFDCNKDMCKLNRHLSMLLLRDLPFQ